MSEPRSPGRRVRLAVTPAAVAAVLLATVLLDGRGGRDDPDAAPAVSGDRDGVEPVSDQEFCSAYERLNLAFGDLVADPSRRTTRDLKSAVTVVAEMVDGTGMDERARAGARFIASSILALDDVADAEDIAAFDAAAGIDDTANAKALGQHVEQVC